MRLILMLVMFVPRWSWAALPRAWNGSSHPDSFASAMNSVLDGFISLVCYLLLVMLIPFMLRLLGDFALRLFRQKVDVGSEQNNPGRFSAVDKRIITLRNKARSRNQDCQENAIEGLSFAALTRSLDQLIGILRRDKGLNDTRIMRKYIHGKLNFYLTFMDKYESVTGYLDNYQRSEVEKGLQAMISATDEVVQAIVNGKMLGIEVGADVAEQLNK